MRTGTNEGPAAAGLAAAGAGVELEPESLAEALEALDELHAGLEPF